MPPSPLESIFGGGKKAAPEPIAPPAPVKKAGLFDFGKKAAAPAVVAVKGKAAPVVKGKAAPVKAAPVVKGKAAPAAKVVAKPVAKSAMAGKKAAPAPAPVAEKKKLFGLF